MLGAMDSLPNRPSREVDVAIIGAGTAGLAAYRAASNHTDSVLLIEGADHGTTCARVGCMPSKLLIAAADAAHQIERAEGFGIDAKARVDGKRVMARVRSERDRFVGFVVRGVESIPEDKRMLGFATFQDDHTLRVGEESIGAKSIVIATGSSPTKLPMFHSLDSRLVVNDDIFQWDDLPGSVAVFGPGIVGLELGQSLHRLGVRVRIFGVGGQVGPVSDPEVLAYARKTFETELELDADATVESLRRIENGVIVTYLADGKAVEETFEVVLAATGRHPNVRGLGLENTSLELDRRGVPLFDPATLRAGTSSIFIAGDVTNHLALLHEASDEGSHAGENAATFPAMTNLKRRSALGIVFSDPQMAMIGSRHAELADSGEPFVIGEVSFEDQGRSRVMLRNRGLLRLYADPKTSRLLGAEMIGPDAEHLAHLLAWAHQQELTVGKMLAMPFYHPVVEEGLRTALRDACAKIGAHVAGANAGAKGITA